MVLYDPRYRNNSIALNKLLQSSITRPRNVENFLPCSDVWVLILNLNNKRNETGNFRTPLRYRWRKEIWKDKHTLTTHKLSNISLLEEAGKRIDLITVLDAILPCRQGLAVRNDSVCTGIGWQIGSRLYSPNSDAAGPEDAQLFFNFPYICLNFFSREQPYPAKFRQMYGKLKKLTERLLAKLHPSNLVNKIFYLVF